MTQQAVHPAAAQERPPWRILLTILHLAGFGVFGLAVIGGLFGVLGAGIGLLFVLGAGVFVLLGLVYALFGIAWFEVERVSGLYGLEQVSRLRWCEQRQPGFKEWIRAVGRQCLDGRMWRALGSFALASLMGTAMLPFAQSLASSIAGLVQSLVTGSASTGGLLFWAFDVVQPLSGVFDIVLSAAAIVGLALLHRVILVPLVSAGVREEQLSAQVAATEQQREGAVRAADVERTRIERDLHDGVQPRLVSVAMTLGLAREKIEKDPEQAKALVDEAHTSTKAAITELRQLARGIYASVLDDRGLDAALSALAARSHIPVRLDVRLHGRCSREAEAAVYFAIAESLTNAAKHSRASECRVAVRRRGDDPGATLWARVEDNGVGGARIVPGGGLDGIVHRVAAAGGSSALDSPRGGPTALEVSVPCAS